MEKVTILELYRTARNNNEPLFGLPTDLSDYTFMEEYLSKFTRLDRNFAKTHAHFAPLWNTQYEADKSGVYTSFRDDVTDMIVKNHESYQRLWDALIEAEYNPVENYDKISEIITDIGKRKRTEDFGQATLTKNYGASSRSEVRGARSGSNTKGARSDSDTYGATSNEDHHFMQGFNSANANETESDTHSAIAHTDQHSEGQQVDQHSEQAYTDQISEVAKVDSDVNSARQDVFNDDAAQDKVTEHTHGNIGVTSAEDLITQEVVLRTANRFYEILFNDIISELCILVDTADFGAFSICLNKHQKVLREVAQYDDFTMYVDEESGLYVVYENGSVVPNFTYDPNSGNLYIENREGYEIHLRFDEETGELYRVDE